MEWSLAEYSFAWNRMFKGDVGVCSLKNNKRLWMSHFVLIDNNSHHDIHKGLIVTGLLDVHFVHAKLIPWLLMSSPVFLKHQPLCGKSFASLSIPILDFTVAQFYKLPMIWRHDKAFIYHVGSLWISGLTRDQTKRILAWFDKRQRAINNTFLRGLI